MAGRSRSERLSALRRLKRAGLFSGDIQKASKSSYGRFVLSRFDFYLAGQAKSITYASSSAAKRVAKVSGGIARGKKVIVRAPKFLHMKSHLRTRRGRIKTLYYFNGEAYTIRNIPSVHHIDELERARGEEMYIFISGSGKPVTFTPERLETLWNSYDREQQRKFVKVVPYINILEPEHS